MRKRSSSEADNRVFPAAIADRLKALETLGIAGLRLEWQRLHRVPAPPCFSRDLLLRAVAYRLQETSVGGLPSSVRCHLASLGRKKAIRGGEARLAPVRLKVGATLVRTWSGRTHTILVLDDSFEYEGRRYASLSHIAREITGAHWSGPRFFGLRRSEKRTTSRGGSKTAGDGQTAS